MPTFTGTSGDDTIQGTPLPDVIDGLEGNDTLRGGGGNDLIFGREGEDLLVGNMQNDHLEGGDGNDFLVPLGGTDYIDGGDGQDSIIFEGIFPNQGVTFDLRLQGQAQATGFYGIKTVFNVEHVFGTRFSDIIHGDDNLNVLSAGGSIAQPQVGNDQLFGHGGDDIFQLTAGNHLIDGGDGLDTVSTSFTTADMGAFSINLNIAGSQDTGQGMMTFVSISHLVGGRYDDRLEGDGADNKLAGAYGNDTLIGGAGNDRLSGDGALALGEDRLLTPSLSGFGNGDDILDGGAGDDLLTGGEGGDLMTGGAGADTFLFLGLADSTVGNADLITDFVSGNTLPNLPAKVLAKMADKGMDLSHDILDLSAIDADTTADGDQAFNMVKAFGNRPGEAMLEYDSAANVTHLLLDVDGDSVADMMIDFSGRINNLSSDSVIF